MKKRNCCQWCHRICTEPTGFDSRTRVLVCSDECRDAETNFQIYFSDKEIGKRNMTDFGINPNKRGRLK